MSERCKMCNLPNDMLVKGICPDCVDKLQIESEDKEVDVFLERINDASEVKDKKIAALEERVKELEADVKRRRVRIINLYMRGRHYRKRLRKLSLDASLAVACPPAEVALEKWPRKREVLKEKP